MLSSASAAFFCHPREWTETVGYHGWIIFLIVASTEPSIRTETCIMIILFGHPATESLRKWETPEVFSKALAPSSA